MATAPPPPAPKKLSFAKVVAAHPNLAPHSRVAIPAIDRRPQPSASASVATRQHHTAESATTMGDPLSSTKGPEGSTPQNPQSSQGVDANMIVQGVKDMDPSPNPPSFSTPPSLVVNGSSSSLVEPPDKNDNGASLSDDVSQPADSNSEMGTKPPSLDGKSITSGTTFALDEKESLRPDDSASVKAAADDDEAFSVKGSLLATSRVSSDIARIHRLRIGDMPDKRIIQTPPEVRDQGMATPQSGVSSQQPVPEQMQVIGGANMSSDVFNSMYGKNPDDKLLEAMKSPKDRLFLLRLEQDVINFVQSSKEPYMDLPPNNSFCRMLTHKLADYYHMTHSFEAIQGAVRIYRTPFCRVPSSLASLMDNEPDESASTPPPVVLPKKIMRRGEDNGSGQVSTNASKATSEVGSDGKEKTTLAKEKMTREEREEAYKRTRERIFGSSSEKPAEVGQDDDGNGVSRASSVSGKDKAGNPKRKPNRHRRDDSDSFPTRSHYVQYFHPQAQTEWSRHPISANVPYNGQPHHIHQNQMAQAYQAAPQGYGYSSYGYASTGQSQPPSQPLPQPQMQPHTPGQPVPWYSSSNGSMGTYGPGAQPMPLQQWQPGFGQTTPPPAAPVTYQDRGPQAQAQAQPQGSPRSMAGIPYAYGQLPVNVNPHDPKSQHPIPGSYNRHAFNPKIQSFVPGNGMSSGQPPIGSYNMVPSAHNSPQVGSPHLAYNGFNTPAAATQSYMGVGPAYGMARQGSNNSLPPHHAPSHVASMVNRPVMGSQAPPAGPSQGYTHLPNYGNPATLPQKPPSGL